MDNISISPSAVHQALKTKLTNLIQEYCDKNNLNQVEILVVASQIVGMIIAFQDQRVFNQEQIMEIVTKNIQEGNQIAVLQLHKIQGRA